MICPDEPDELTAAWLGSVLSDAVAVRAEVESFDACPLAGEQGMTGQVVRLRLRYAEPHPDLPTRLIAKFATVDPDARSIINGLGHYVRENRFYTHLSDRVPVQVPRCYLNHHNEATGAAVLLLEDLTRLRPGNTVAGCTVGDVRRVLVDLGRLHAAWWQQPELSDLSWLQLRSKVGPEAMIDVHQRVWSLFLAKLSIPVTSEIRELGAWITESLPPAVSLFRDGPATLVHNDLQADNLFFDDVRGHTVFIDWQMVTSARGVVDVAGWIRGQLEPETRRVAESELVCAYHDALVANGVQGYPLDQCRSDYELATVLAPARLACAVGMSGGLQAHQGAFWDTLFPRFLLN